MRHEVQETGRLTLTVPPQDGPVCIEIRFPRIRGRKATVIVESRNWHVQSQVVHPKRDRGRQKPRKMIDSEGVSGLD